MGRIHAFTAILLITVLFPATVEVVENVVHYAQFGHLSILEGTTHHHHLPDSQKGCTQCCGHHHGNPLSAPFVLTGWSPDLGPRDAGRAVAVGVLGGVTLAGFSPNPFRPPIA